MGDQPERLRVPDPDEVDSDPEGPLETLALAGILSVMFMLGIALLSVDDNTQSGESPTPPGNLPGAGAPTAASTTSKDTPPTRELVRNLAGKHEASEDIAWTPEHVDAVLRHGPRELTELACRAVFTGDAQVEPRRFRADLLSLVDRRADHAPWSCIWRRYLEDDLPETSSLYDEIHTLWSDSAQLFRPIDPPLASVVISWHPDRRGLPDDKRVLPWLRLCALQYDFQAATACQQVLAGLAPEQGRDLLSAIEAHLNVTDPGDNAFDLPLLIEGLGSIAEHGQPDGWRLLETEAMPDYDADIRIGAAFYLCRFVNSPDTSVAERAARNLTSAAGYTPRMVNESLRKRWVKSCKLAFGSETDDGTRAPALAVWSGDPDSQPDYTLQGAIERGDCKTDGPEPDWYCAVRQFNGNSVSELDDFFVQSRGIESHDTDW